MFVFVSMFEFYIKLTSVFNKQVYELSHHIFLVVGFGVVALAALGFYFFF